jgi:hypothetical protein
MELRQPPGSQLEVASQRPLKAPRLSTVLCRHLDPPPRWGPRYRDRDRCGLLDPLDTCTTGCGRGRADTSSCFCCLDCSGEGTAQAQHSESCDERHRLQLQRWYDMVDGGTHGTAIPQLRASSGSKDTLASVSSAEPDRSNVVMAEPDVYGSKPRRHQVKIRDRKCVQDVGIGSGSAVAGFSCWPTEWSDSSGDSIELVVANVGAGGPRTSIVECIPIHLWPKILSFLLHHCNWGDWPCGSWKKRGHWPGGCGQSCGCCRSHNPEDAAPNCNCERCYTGWVMTTVCKEFYLHARRCADSNGACKKCLARKKCVSWAHENLEDVD